MMGRSQTSLRIQTSQKPFSTSKLAPTTLPYHLPPPSYPGVASAAEGSPCASTSQSTMTAQVFQIRLPLRVWMTTRVEMGASNHSHSVLLHPNSMMTLSLSVQEMQRTIASSRTSTIRYIRDARVRARGSTFCLGLSIIVQLSAIF